MCVWFTNLDALNSKLSELLEIKPLKLIDKRSDEDSKFTLFTFLNDRLPVHKYLFAALFAALSLQDEFKKNR